MLFDIQPIGGAAAYSDEWLTPPPIIHALGRFDVDPCTPIIRPWDTATVHYNKNTNGLAQPWDGRVWCNPPYSDIAPWMKRLSSYGNGIALIFARTETASFFRYVWPKADSIFFFAGRIKFYKADGRAAKNGVAPSVLVAYGRNNVEAIEQSNLQGKHQRLNYTPIIVVGVSPTWFSVVTIAVKQFGDKELQPVYDMVARIAPDKCQKNPHWKAKVRQQVQEFRKTQTIEI